MIMSPDNPLTISDLLLSAQRALRQAKAPDDLLGQVPLLFSPPKDGDFAQMEEITLNHERYLHFASDLEAFSLSLKDAGDAALLQESLSLLEQASLRYREEIGKHYQQSRKQTQHIQSYLDQSI